MFRTMKKVWAYLLVLCLLMGVLPISAQAALLDGSQYITQQLSLGEDLVLHLRASLPEKYEDLAKSATATLTYAGKTKTYVLSDLTPDANGMYDMPIEMAAAEMTDDIHLVVNGKVLGINQEILSEHYSIRDYLVAIIEGDYSQTTKDLCLEVLNMGSWAQLYFNYNISNLANAGYSASPANTISEDSPSVIPEGKVDGIKFSGTTVRFLSQTAVRFYFTADGAVDGYTFTMDGAEYTPVAKDGMYYIETPGINPQDMSKEIAVSVTNGTQTLCVDYAPIWYFIRTYNRTEEEYSKGLMEAAYSYYKTAESYKTQICMDLDVSTLSGSFESIGLGFYPLDFEGDINDYTDRIEVPTGTTYTVKLDQGKYLVDGEFLGIGVTVLGGPTWDATLPDGSPDRHNIQISGLRLEGPEDRPIDLSLATITSGQDGTGYTNANAGGTAAVADGVLSISNGFFTDGYKITFNEVETYFELDMEVNTVSGNYESIGIGFYPYNFEGDINNYVDRIEVPTGAAYTVKLDVSKYLVDGELPGIGFAVLGGPEWNTQISDGVYDRHSITISNLRLEGELDQIIDLSQASLASGTNGTGYTNANAGGTAVLADGIVSITGGFFTDGYKLTFVDETIPEETEPEATEPEATEPEATEPPVVEPDNALCIDMLFTTLGGSTDPVEIGFYPYSFEGDINNHTDKITITAGTKTTVKLDAAKYMVNGEISGIGFAIFGGPAWDAKLPDGYTPDRHTITISAVYLEGEQNTVYDLSKSAWANGNNGTGFTNANGSGAAVIGSEIVISNGFQYDGHKISLVEDTNTYISMDVLITTLSNSTDPIEIGFYPENFAGDFYNEPTKKMGIAAGTKTTIKLDVDDYLVNGEFTGMGLGIFSGPEWNTPLEAGGYDRVSITVSNVCLEGQNAKKMVVDDVTIGLTNANAAGAASVVDGTAVITDTFRYTGYMISLVEDTNTYISMDVLITTLSNSTDPIEIGFYPENFAGDFYNEPTKKMGIAAGTKTTIKLKVDDYLVDGEFTGMGLGIFSGPEWNTPLEAGGYDRVSITVSNVCLEGQNAKKMVVDDVTVGLTNANAAGAASVVDGTAVITDTFRYTGYMISLVEDTNTYIEMDLLLDTLGGNWPNNVEIRFCNNSQEDSVHSTYADSIVVTPGQKVTVRLNAEKYLVNGELVGFSIAIFGGPEWNTQLEDGTYDRHSVVISNLRLTGVGAAEIELSNENVSTGISGSNSGGQIAVVDGQVVISGGFCYDGHKITF